MSNLETAVLGGGCFWCLEAAFKQIAGVQRVVSGYAGGSTKDPDYEQVCSGTTGHAEVVQLEFDPEQVSYASLLEFFWRIHDPTTLNRQGADHGTQYRSIILYTSEQQMEEAWASKHRLDASGRYPHPSVTEIVPLKRFYPAEDFHQGYFTRNPQAGYCRAVIAPKLARVPNYLQQIEGISG